MKSKLVGVMGLAVMTLTVALVPAAAQKTAQYTLTDLGTIAGSPFTQGYYINNRGTVAGIALGQDGAQHAALWSNGSFKDISSPGLGGPNSGAFGINDSGKVSGQAENATLDPNNENFCDYFTGLECVPVRWQNGVMTPLPLLGGNNGTIANINRSGAIAGAAETGSIDSTCPGFIAVNGTGPQVLNYLPVVWGAKANSIRTLGLLPGDTVGMALWVNDQGQAAGYTGTCATSVQPPFAAGAHAVMWDADGTPHDLGSFGGTFNPNQLGVGNVAFAINNRGQVTGLSAFPGSTEFHAFVWTMASGMQDLGTRPGDVNSGGLGMNNVGDIVGASVDGPLETGTPTAVLWHNGNILDLNTAIPAGSSLYLLNAFMVNDGGQIVGFGIDMNTFEIHGFLLTPISGSSMAARGAAALSDAAKQAVRANMGVAKSSLRR